MCIITSFALLLPGCDSTDKSLQSTSNRVVAVIHPIGSSQCSGVIYFTETGNSVTIEATITGLKPNSSHGFHIHQFGDCSAADGTSAGGHYNPDGYPHAGPTVNKRHAGDLGNITADANGKGFYQRTVSNISIAGNINPILGLGIIIHAGPDDLVSQPTGAAGSRIGCGTIGWAQAAQ